MDLNAAGLEKQSVIVVVLIPFREVPDRFTSQERSMMGQAPGCPLLIKMFVDTNNTVFLHCNYNDAQLQRIVDYITKSTESKVVTRHPVLHAPPSFPPHSAPNATRKTTTNAGLPQPPQVLGKNRQPPSPHISKLLGKTIRKPSILKQPLFCVKAWCGK